MILFVDDEARQMDSYRRELELSQLEVRCIRRTDDAITYFKQNIEQIKVLILDIMMPPGASFEKEDTQQGLRTGLKFFELVRRHAPELPVIVFTNVSDPSVKEYFAKKSNCWFLRKEDYLPFELAEEVQKVMKQIGR